jgi:hypothetical protein
MFNQANYTNSATPLNNNNSSAGTVVLPITNNPNSNSTITLTNATDPNERENLRILQTLNVQIQSMALKLDQILTKTEEVRSVTLNLKIITNHDHNLFF